MSMSTSTQRPVGWASHPGWMGGTLLIAIVLPVISLVVVIPCLRDAIRARDRGAIAAYTIALVITVAIGLLVVAQMLIEPGEVGNTQLGPVEPITP